MTDEMSPSGISAVFYNVSKVKKTKSGLTQKLQSLMTVFTNYSYIQVQVLLDRKVFDNIHKKYVLYNKFHII